MSTVVALACTLPGAALAQAAPAINAPRVDIIGKTENLERLPGSGEVVDRDTLERSRVFTTNEALRKITGVNVRDEEGLGLRPNIGIRGLNPTRSTKITLLEDGIPLAYAPYGDNASYFHPPIERYERIEVLKGSGQVLYGPQTIGGVINYITPNPTEEFSGFLGVSAGNRDYGNLHARLSGAGFLLDAYHKQSDGARDNLRSELRDVTLKKVIRIDGRQSLIVRGNLLNEESNVGYSGLSVAEYATFGARYNPFFRDTFDTRRIGLSATHEFAIDDNTTLLTNIYGSVFSRDWWRQSSTTTDTQCGTAFRDARLAGQAVNPDTCASRQGRLRDYQMFGVEPRLRMKHQWLGLASELETGFRVHREIQDRKQVNGTSPFSRDGVVVEDNNRNTNAMAAFVQNRFLLGDLTLTPALRYENIENTRWNRLPGGSSGSETLSAWIPSLGANYQMSPDTVVFGGVHRGFAPPRNEDLIITPTGSSATYTNVGAENSWNFEFGTRTRPMPGLDLQATVFRNDFQRIIAVGSIAGGSTPLSQGQALFQGLEVGGRYGDPTGVYSTLALTWLPTAEQSTAFTEVSTGGVIANSRAGNRMPYAPKTTATVGVGYLHNSGFDVNLEMVHVGEQYADFANVGDAASDPNVPGATQTINRQSGQFGLIESFTIFNVAANYALPQYGVTVFFTIKNLADRVYVVDRSRGMIPGSPRLIQAGLRWSF
jgi:Fe(3+) dicitrate transport protein